MKKIYKYVIGVLVVLLLCVSNVFANIDSTRATWIWQSDLNYNPFGNDVWNKCGYDIGFILWYHEWYLRKYAMLMPVQYDVDSIIDGVVVSSPWCSDWLKHISTDVCSNSYLKTDFIATTIKGIESTWLLMSIKLYWDYQK